MENILGLVVGAGLGVAAAFLYQRVRGLPAAKREAEMLAAAERRADLRRREVEAELREEASVMRAAFDRKAERARVEGEEAERRLVRREELAERRSQELTVLAASLDEKGERARQLSEDAASRSGEARELSERLRATLTEVAGLTKEEARRRALESFEAEVRVEAAERLQSLIRATEEDAQRQAQKIVAHAVQRVGVRYAIEHTTTTVELATDDIKGRIIGREGRNIRSFEKEAGVDLIIDDTPCVVTISSFDAERREVARLALIRLIDDGRIQPSRIEEVVQEIRSELDENVRSTARRVLHELEVSRVDRRLEHCLGRLKYRTSYGQNQLEHAVEVAWIAAAIAGEMGLDPGLARRCGLFHDIGKSLDHEMQGGHPAIGADLLRRCNEAPEVVNSAAAHHGDQPFGSAYAVIAQVADAISAARPGARRDSMERYIRRLEELEATASGLEGVDSAFAVQAGRELRVLVDARRTDDAEAALLARRIAKKIESELAVAGEVKVTVIRETRVTEYVR